MSIAFTLQKPSKPLSVSISSWCIQWGGGGGGGCLRCIGIRWPSLLKHQAKILNTALIECPSLGQRGPGVPPLGAQGGAVWPSGGAWPQNPAWGTDCHQPEPSLTPQLPRSPLRLSVSDAVPLSVQLALSYRLLLSVLIRILILHTHTHTHVHTHIQFSLIAVSLSVHRQMVNKGISTLNTRKIWIISHMCFLLF